MNKVIHPNYWYWGESYTIVIDIDNPKRDCISGLSVVNNIRNI